MSCFEVAILADDAEYHTGTRDLEFLSPGAVAYRLYKGPSSESERKEWWYMPRPGLNPLPVMDGVVSNQSDPAEFIDPAPMLARPCRP